MADRTTTGSGSGLGDQLADRSSRPAEITEARGQSTLATTKRTGDAGEFPVAGVAIGRPVKPRLSWSTGFRLYSQKLCISCGRPAWFGPRLTELIDAGTAKPACADCMVEALAAGAKPESLIDLGNPEGGRRG